MSVENSVKYYLKHGGDTEIIGVLYHSLSGEPHRMNNSNQQNITSVKIFVETTNRLSLAEKKSLPQVLNSLLTLAILANNIQLVRDLMYWGESFNEELPVEAVVSLVENLSQSADDRVINLIEACLSRLEYHLDHPKVEQFYLAHFNLASTSTLTGLHAGRLFVGLVKHREHELVVQLKTLAVLWERTNQFTQIPNWFAVWSFLTRTIELDQLSAYFIQLPDNIQQQFWEVKRQHKRSLANFNPPKNPPKIIEETKQRP